MTRLLALLRCGWISMRDLYPTDPFPDWIRTWPDGTQEVLLRDGSTRRVSARHEFANHPDFAETRVGFASPLYPFDGTTEGKIR